MEEKVEVKSYKSRILLGLVVTFIIMSIVYIPLAFKAKFGKVDQSKSWDVESTIVKASSIHGGASEKYKPYTIGNTIYFGVVLKQPGDYIDYEVEVNNKGILDARLDKILVSVDDTENTKKAIRYTVNGIRQNDVVKAGDKKVISIRVEWDPAVQETISRAYSTMIVNLQFVQN